MVSPQYLLVVTPGDPTSIRQTVRAALRGHPRAVLAVSGGLDSMVLLDAAAAVVPRERLIVATFDHGTGPAATTARALVEQRASELGIACVAEQSSLRLTTEAELRGARWRFLRGVAASQGGKPVICTAHTASDQVETVLMRVLRGASARGLAGLLAGSSIIRPLLNFTRAELSSYARGHGVTWVEDPTNESPRYFRNRVRHDLLPAMRRVRPSIDAELLAIGRRAAEWRRSVEEYVVASVDVHVLDEQRGVDVGLRSLADLSIAELRMVWPAIAARAGVALDRRGTVRVAEFSRRGQAGSRMQLSGGWIIVRSRDALQLRATRPAEATPAPLALSNDTRWGDWAFHPVDGNRDASPWVAWLPTDLPLTVRSWQPGDAMTRRSGGTPRKVKKLLSEAGVSGHQRAGWPVVLSGDQIVWIPGVRRGDVESGRAGRPGLHFVGEYLRR